MSDEAHNFERAWLTLSYFWGLMPSKWTRQFQPAEGFKWADIQRTLDELLK